MATQSLETNVHHRPGMAIIELHGEITILATDALNTAYAQAQSRHPELVLLNFAGVNYINSPGLGLIIGLLAQAHQTVIGCGLGVHYMEIFAITGLTKLMPIVLDENHTYKERLSKNDVITQRIAKLANKTKPFKHSVETEGDLQKCQT